LLEGSSYVPISYDCKVFGIRDVDNLPEPNIISKQISLNINSLAFSLKTISKRTSPLSSSLGMFLL